MIGGPAVEGPPTGLVYASRYGLDKTCVRHVAGSGRVGQPGVVEMDHHGSPAGVPWWAEWIHSVTDR